MRQPSPDRGVYSCTQAALMSDRIVVESQLYQAMGIDPAQNIQITVGYVEVSEMTEPSAPGANKARIFLEDDGVSPNRSRLMVRFPSGASQQIAFEP